MAQAETISRDGLDEPFGSGAVLTLALMRAELVRVGTTPILQDDFWATRPQLPEDAPDFGCAPTAR
jgi:hypothetical protein